MELIYLISQNDYDNKTYLNKEKRTLYTWNTLKLRVDEFDGLMMVLDSNKLTLDTSYDKKGRVIYNTDNSLEKAIYYVEPFKHKGCIHCMMNTSIIDDKWCYPVLKKYIKPNDEVCVFAFSFFDDTKNLNDWNKQYAKGQGIWYKENTDVFYKYGLKENQIHWVNYFTNTKEEIENKILNSSIILFTGGAPDLMMKRIKEFKLKSLLKNYQGLMMGYSAGAMIQLGEYHITPDSDYPGFKYLTGLACINDFKIEVHYHASNLQKECIDRVLKEKGQPVYAIYEDGGLIAANDKIELFGRVELFDR